MNESESLVHSENLPPGRAGELLQLPRQKANWEWMSFFVRRLVPGDSYKTATLGEETAENCYQRIRFTRCTTFSTNCAEY